MSLSDEYEFDRDEAPSAFIRVRFASPDDRHRFLRVLSEVAARIGLTHQPGGTLFNGEQLPGFFTSVDMLLVPGVFDSRTELGEPYAQARLELRRRSFPAERFRTLAADFLACVRGEFGTRVDLSSAP